MTADIITRCPICQRGRRRAVVADSRTEIWVNPDPEEFGWIALELPAHGGRPLAYPLQGSELADARRNREPLYRHHIHSNGEPV